MRVLRKSILVWFWIWFWRHFGNAWSYSWVVLKFTSFELLILLFQHLPVWLYVSKVVVALLTRRFLLSLSTLWPHTSPTLSWWSPLTKELWTLIWILSRDLDFRQIILLLMRWSQPFLARVSQWPSNLLLVWSFKAVIMSFLSILRAVRSWGFMSTEATLGLNELGTSWCGCCGQRNVLCTSATALFG